MIGRSFQRSVSLGGSMISSRALLGASSTQRRWLNVHEYLSHDLMRKYDVSVCQGAVATTPQKAGEIFESFGRDCVVKAQVLAGGRGKGTFTNGFQGGVHVVTSKSQAETISSKMLGQRLVTKQSGADGKMVNQVYICERLYLRREVYFAILLDRSFDGPVMVASSQGGMDIEKVASETPELILKEGINILTGPTDEQLTRLASGMGFSGHSLEDSKTIMKNLYKLFVDTDATLVEINPLGETPDGKVLCVDAKLNFDQNAEFRQQAIHKLRDTSQEDPREVAAAEHDLNYIGLDGSIGCLVNGAGLAMATMDIIKLKGGNPANFLDLGGGANENQVTKAFEILNNDKNVKAILVNIFGGIMRCDIIALGIIKAVTEIGLKKPLVVRLEGTNVDAAKQLIENSGLRILTSDDLDDAANKAVRVAEIVKMAEAVDVSVKFELPL